MNKITYILAIAFLVLPVPGLMSQAHLKVEIYNIRSNKGHLLLSVYNNSEQFPRNPAPGLSDIQVSKRDMRKDTVNYFLDNLQPGKYVVAILDDENGSGDMEYNQLGIPMEGFGFSNNINPMFSTPPYHKCQFAIKEGMNSISIKVRYR